MKKGNTKTKKIELTEMETKAEKSTRYLWLDLARMIKKVYVHKRLTEEYLVAKYEVGWNAFFNTYSEATKKDYILEHIRATESIISILEIDLSVEATDTRFLFRRHMEFLNKELSGVEPDYDKHYFHNLNNVEAATLLLLINDTFKLGIRDLVIAKYMSNHVLHKEGTMVKSPKSTISKIRNREIETVDTVRRIKELIMQGDIDYKDNRKFPETPSV